MDNSVAAFDSLSELWDRLETYPVSAEIEANLYLMRTLSEWLAADYAYWCGLARLPASEVADDDPLGGWRMRVGEPYKIAEVYTKRATSFTKTSTSPTWSAPPRSPSCRTPASIASGCSASLSTSPSTRSRSTSSATILPYGLTDRVYIVTPVSDGAESCYVFELAGDDRRFDSEDVALVGAALRRVRWFQRRLILSHGLQTGCEPLSPLERQIVQLLLTDKSEKDIAAVIDRAPSTTHNYVTGLYRKFGVNNRAALMSLWIELLPRG